jgi:hypothetical protein
VITTGSKFLLGVGFYGVVATLAYVVASDFERTGMVTLGSMAVVALLLGGLTLAIRDGQIATDAYPDGRKIDVDTIGRGPLVSASVLPVLAAFGVALLLLGLAFSRWYTVFGGVLLAGVVAEWMVQSWSDRASDDGEYNRNLRDRVMRPIEYPVLGALAVGLVIFGFSRVMLAVNKDAAVVVFILVAALVLVVASLFAGVRRIGGEVLVGTLMVGGIIVLTAGVISFVYGERGFHEPEGEGANTETVADVASVAARLELTSAGLSQTELSIPRSAQTSVTFNNSLSSERRFVLEAAEGLVCAGQPPAEEPEPCESAFVEDGQTTFLTFQFTLPGVYAFAVEGEGGSDRIEGTVVVA